MFASAHRDWVNTAPSRTELLAKTIPPIAMVTSNSTMKAPFLRLWAREVYFRDFIFLV